MRYVKLLYDPSMARWLALSCTSALRPEPSAGVLFHVMDRGIQGTLLFRTDEKRGDFPRRLARLLDSTGSQVLAWALQLNHVFLLVHMGARLSARRMLSLPIGYAGAFDRAATSSLGP